MIEVKQKHLRNPDKGVQGDCWRACMASILEIDLELLSSPNQSKFFKKDYKDKVYFSWDAYSKDLFANLKKLGYKLRNISINEFTSELTDTYLIATGKSPRGDFLHAVVWHNGICFDPHPDNTGIWSIRNFEILEKINNNKKNMKPISDLMNKSINELSDLQNPITDINHNNGKYCTYKGECYQTIACRAGGKKLCRYHNLP